MLNVECGSIFSFRIWHFEFRNYSHFHLNVLIIVSTSFLTKLKTGCIESNRGVVLKYNAPRI